MRYKITDPFLKDFLILFSISFSVFGSKALVASSKIKIFGFLYIALAIAILCFWPPDIFIPSLPTLVSKPLSKLLKKLPNFEILLPHQDYVD